MRRWNQLEYPSFSTNEQAGGMASVLESRASWNTASFPPSIQRSELDAIHEPIATKWQIPYIDDELVLHSLPTICSERSDRSLFFYRPEGRMTEASGKNAQDQRIMAVIGDVVLPKLPDFFAVEEARRIKQQKKAEFKQELQVVKGLSW